MQMEGRHHHHYQPHTDVGLVGRNFQYQPLVQAASHVYSHFDHVKTYSCHQSHKILFLCSLYKYQADSPILLLF